ncbi:MAG: tetratricopeptide repeat protein [Pseudomonadota bacterium]
MIDFRALHSLAQAGRTDEALARWRGGKPKRRERPLWHTVGGQLLASAGDLVRAEHQFRQALKLEPRNLGALVGLGDVLRQTGRERAAIKPYRRALDQRPRDPVLSINLALCLAHAGESDEAQRLLGPIVPGVSDPRALLQCATVMRVAGDTDSAVTLLERGLTRSPNAAPLLNELGLVRQAAGALDAAAASFEQAIAADPAGVPPRNNLGAVRELQGALGAAETAWRDSLARCPEQPEVQVRLANVLRELERPVDAEALLRETLAAVPDFVAARHDLSALLEEGNRITEAREVLGDAPAEHPLLLLMDARIRRREDDFETALGRLAGAGFDDPVLEARRLRERALSLDALERYDEAWNSLEARAPLVTRPAVQTEHDGWLAGYAAHGLTRLEEAASLPPGGDSAPVFLVGFPRSGTTLLGRVLGAHPGIAEMEERSPLDHVARAVPGWPSSPLDPQQAPALRQRYEAAARERFPAAEGRWLDRMPANILHVPLIRQLWPDAPIIMMLRHPLDVCISCAMQEFRPNWLTQRLTTFDDAVVAYETLMTPWPTWAGTAGAHLVRYEELVSRPRATVAGVLQFLGEDEDRADTMLAERHRAPAARTASYFQVDAPIGTASVERWRHYASHVGTAANRLGELGDALGYAMPDSGGAEPSA